MLSELAHRLVRQFHLEDDILCESFESLPVWFHHGNRYMTGPAGIDICDDAGFAFMDASDDLAFGAVLEFAWWFSFHLIVLVAFRQREVKGPPNENRSATATVTER
jgi:hypothetical protein